jgi:hypothetical protein
VLVGQVHSTAVDLLRASGMHLDEAAGELDGAVRAASGCDWGRPGRPRGHRGVNSEPQMISIPGREGGVRSLTRAWVRFTRLPESPRGASRGGPAPGGSGKRMAIQYKRLGTRRRELSWISVPKTSRRSP